MSEADLRRRIIDLAEQRGERAVQSALVAASVAPGTAQKLTSGRYPNEPGPLLRAAILRALNNINSEEAS